jgi:hypothetical protein
LPTAHNFRQVLHDFKQSQHGQIPYALQSDPDGDDDEFDLDGDEPEQMAHIRYVDRLCVDFMGKAYSNGSCEDGKRMRLVPFHIRSYSLIHPYGDAVIISLEENMIRMSGPEVTA